LLFGKHCASLDGREGIGGFGNNVWKLLARDTFCPILDVDFSCLILVVEVIENILESLLLNDDSNLFNASVEAGEVKFSRVVNIKELKLFDKESFFTGKGV